MSRAMFYKLVKQGEAPRFFKVGRLTRISKEAAQQWLTQREERVSPVIEPSALVPPEHKSLLPRVRMNYLVGVR